MGDVLNPVAIEQRMQEIARRIHEGVKVVSAAESAARAARHAADVAYAQAYMAHQGAAHEKRYAATIATAEEAHAADVAEVAFRHAERTARALENELRAVQSVGASVRSMYSAERGFGS